MKEGCRIEDEVAHGGACFDRGYISSYFITEAESQTVKLEKSFVLLADQKISLLKQFFLARGGASSPQAAANHC